MEQAEKHQTARLFTRADVVHSWLPCGRLSDRGEKSMEKENPHPMEAPPRAGSPMIAQATWKITI